jgi:glucose/arabinose dehydrogenase
MPTMVQAQRAIGVGWRTVLLLVGVLLASTMLGPLAPGPVAAQATVPPGFLDEAVADNLGLPTAFAVVPTGTAGLAAGDVYVTDKNGVVSLVPGAGGTASRALDLSGRTCAQGERGLLGIALDPAFAANNRIYLYLTERSRGECFNRVYRFVANADGTIDPKTGVRLLSTSKLGPTNHNAGDLRFGSDGFLYVSIGENARDVLAQRRSTLFGKIVRITTDGRAPGSNPFVSNRAARCAETGRARKKRQPCAEIFALGLRNPFRFTIAADGATLFINDVGAGSWEEINRGVAGANYGWPEREGPCPQGEVGSCAPGPERFTDPVFAYEHRDEDCRSITGGAFVSTGVGWGEFEGDYLYADAICDKIFALSDPLGANPQNEPFSPLADFVIALGFDPLNPNELLYTTFSSGGELRRITPPA